MNIKPKITLVGAGPGDAGLITLNGIKALGKADALLYDALVNTELLGYAPANAPRIFVGKRNKRHSCPQEEINRLMVRHAFRYGHVVRLKGGDPFVFGRGMEEIKYAELFGIEAEVIPGVSSCTAIPALSGIPVTHRGASESFWVITGTTRKGKLSNDIKAAAQTRATVVILMGLTHLAGIVKAYKEAGKADAAIAIIQEGSLPGEQSLTGTIETVETLAQERKIKAPAIIVIGEVVKLHKEFPLRINERTYQLN